GAASCGAARDGRPVRASGSCRRSFPVTSLAGSYYPIALAASAVVTTALNWRNLSRRQRPGMPAKLRSARPPAARRGALPQHAPTPRARPAHASRAAGDGSSRASAGDLSHDGQDALPWLPLALRGLPGRVLDQAEHPVVLLRAAEDCRCRLLGILAAVGGRIRDD